MKFNVLEKNPFIFKRSYKKLLASRIVAFIIYVYVLVIVGLVVLLDDDIRKDIEEDKEIPNDEVEMYVFVVKTGLVVVLLIIILIDFSVRHLVIETLYQRYKRARTPREDV